jgi:hypothetical protein
MNEISRFPVQTSVDIFNLEESDILLVMLGSVDQDIIQELSLDLWFYFLQRYEDLQSKIKYQNKATYLHNIHEVVHERDQQVYG